MRWRLGIGVLSAVLAALGLALPNHALARSQWEIQHPTLPADQDGTYVPGQMPGQIHNGMPPQMNTDFWKGQHPGFVNCVQPGVVLTGILENEIGSDESKPGDTFAITLEEGFVQNGMQVIPQGSKIVGSVTSVMPAKSQRHGMPGQISVSLQALVLPDGNHLPFSGFIASNPNHAFKNPPKQRNGGFDLKDTGSHVAAMMTGFTGGLGGYMYKNRYRGQEFYIDKGEALPIRLNRTLTMPDGVVRPVAAAMPNAIPGSPGISGVPGPLGSIVAPAAPSGGNFQMSSQMVPIQQIPGLAGADSVGQYQAPRPAQAVPGLIGDDPFNAPLNKTSGSTRPLNQMPEPF